MKYERETYYNRKEYKAQKGCLLILVTALIALCTALFFATLAGIINYFVA